MRLYCDNKSAIKIAHNLVQHVEVDNHFIKEKLDSGLICTPYVHWRSLSRWKWIISIHQLEECRRLL